MDAAARTVREDAVHVGATHTTRRFGVPMELAVLLILAGFAIQTNLAGSLGSIQAALWAVASIVPAWVLIWRLTAHDPYGFSVGLAWLRTTAMIWDRWSWGGASCSPLPVENYSWRASRVR